MICSVKDLSFVVLRFVFFKQLMCYSIYNYKKKKKKFISNLVFPNFLYYIFLNVKVCFLILLAFMLFLIKKITIYILKYYLCLQSISHLKGN